jgi:hypothetical protein
MLRAMQLHSSGLLDPRRWDRCPETSVNNYQHTLRNMQEERWPQLYRGRSLNPPTLSLNTIFTTEHIETGRSLMFQR